MILFHLKLLAANMWRHFFVENKSTAGMIRVFMHKGIPFAVRIGADIPQLLINGNVPLAGGGITGISNSCAGRTGGRILFHNHLIALKHSVAKCKKILIIFFLRDKAFIKKFFYQGFVNIRSRFPWPRGIKTTM